MKIVQIGPDNSRPGGIRSVMMMLNESSLSTQFGMKIIPTSSKQHRIHTFLAGFHKLKKCVKRNDCDCVHIHMSENASVYRTAIITQWIKTHSNTKVIIHSHGSSVQTFFLKCNQQEKANLLKCLNMADLFVVLTPGWERWWKSLLPNMKYKVIPNAVNLPNIVNNVHINNNILFLGQLGERKGTYLLISIIKDIIVKHPRAKFVFAGDGEVKKCEEYARRLGVINNCIFFGWANSIQKQKLLQKATMLVLPSKNESFGIVLLEAMSYAKPVICSNGGFMKEIVDDGTNGIIFDYNNKSQLTEAICTLLDNPDYATKLGNSGRQKVENSYSIPVIINLWKQTYMELLS